MCPSVVSKICLGNISHFCWLCLSTAYTCTCILYLIPDVLSYKAVPVFSFFLQSRGQSPNNTEEDWTMLNEGETTTDGCEATAQESAQQHEGLYPSKSQLPMLEK